ncbi:MAG: D-ribose pyranase [Candidatus Promineifilaceae bacterium]|nr:D-ribose pyranase [Candidatus Promineifilaceae bacterium]
MKKHRLLNQPLSATIAGLGHLDELVIADAGLPIPDGPQRIDLALSPGIPSFLACLETVLDEMAVERAVIAEEMPEVSPALHQQLLKVLGDIPVEMLAHSDFKKRTASVAAVVRSGEFTAYANVILIAGVVF